MKQGSGKKELAILVAQYYDNKNNVLFGKNIKEDIYLCICNELLTYSDLIRREKPSKDFHNSIGQLIKLKMDWL